MNFRTFVIKVKGKIGSVVFNTYDFFYDYRICGCSLYLLSTGFKGKLAGIEHNQEKSRVVSHEN